MGLFIVSTRFLLWEHEVRGWEKKYGFQYVADMLPITKIVICAIQEVGEMLLNIKLVHLFTIYFLRYGVGGSIVKCVLTRLYVYLCMHKSL